MVGRVMFTGSLPVSLFQGSWYTSHLEYNMNWEFVWFCLWGTLGEHRCTPVITTLNSKLLSGNHWKDISAFRLLARGHILGGAHVSVTLNLESWFWPLPYCRGPHTASLTWFCRFCMSASWEAAELLLRTTCPLLASSDLWKVLCIETKRASCDVSLRVKPCPESGLEKCSHEIVLHILEDSDHVTLSFPQALCHQQLQKSSNFFFFA